MVRVFAARTSPYFWVQCKVYGEHEGSGLMRQGFTIVLGARVDISSA